MKLRLAQFEVALQKESIGVPSCDIMDLLLFLKHNGVNREGFQQFVYNKHCFVRMLVFKFL